MKRRMLLETDTVGKRKSGCRLMFAPCLPEPERIVGLGFRYWMLGLTSGDITVWERAWDFHCGLFGTAGARETVDRLSRWVAAVGASACRDIDVFPETCRSFCRDECVAVSMIAGCQHHTPIAVESCACALLDAEAGVARVIDAAQTFADALASLDYVLSPSSIVNVGDSRIAMPLQKLH